MSDNNYTLIIQDVVVDVSMLYEVAGDDVDYIKAMVSTFIETTPPTIKRMEQELKANNYSQLSKTAHFAKSALSIIKISDTHSIAQQIEKLAKTATDLNSLPELLEDLKVKVLLASKLLADKFEVTVGVA